VSWAGLFVLGFITLMLGMVLWSGLSTRNMRGQLVEQLIPALPGLENHLEKAVIYCYTEHCGPCKKMAPDIDRLAAAHPNLFKLDVAHQSTEARTLGVRATPTTLLVENGKVLKALLGANAVAAVEIFLDPDQA